MSLEAWRKLQSETIQFMRDGLYTPSAVKALNDQIEAAWNALGDDEQVTAEAEFRKGLAVAVSQGLPLRLESLSCDFMTWLRAGPALVRDHPELVRVDSEDDDDTVPAAIFKHMTEGVDLSAACIAWAKAEGVSR